MEGQSARRMTDVSTRALLVLCHLAAYRMQLFLYLKSSGREELNTLNLWMGMDGPMKPPA